jgi:OmpA-OmpF porin, OOP family
MQYGIFYRIVFSLFFLVFSGCTNRPTQPVVENTKVQKAALETYHSSYFKECQPVDATGMVKKVDNFVIVFDPSASMTTVYEASDGSTADHTDYMYTKFKFAKQLVNCFNKTIPDLELVSLLTTFGYPVYSRLDYGPEPYEQDEYARNLNKIFDADGASPLSPTLDDIGKNLFKLPGKKAVIIISDGEDMGKKEIIAAQELKTRYGDDICIYTIHIGNDKSGRQIMEKIAVAGKCGLSVKGDSLLSKAKMDELVTEIFLIKDSDQDGVPDIKDDCPDTLPGLKVDENGCWKLVALGDVLFDFDKYNLKPEGIKVLNQVVALLKKHNFLDLHISGHTDNFGSMPYNIILSKNRVHSGLNFIKNSGISPERLSISWHSFSIPVATNDNSAGRALNRRLEFTFKKRDN